MLKGRMLTTANLVVVLVNDAALMQILAILVRTAGTRIKAKAKRLVVESCSPLLSPLLGTFVTFALAATFQRTPYRALWKCPCLCYQDAKP